MRIALPERIPLQKLTAVAAAFLIVQVIQGTDYRFAVLHMVFLMVWGFAFNLAGGFTRASGAYVFWWGLLTIPVGTVSKAILGEAADSNAWTPVLTMAVYTVSVFILTIAVYVTRKFTANVVSVAGRLRSYNLDYRNASLGCSFLGFTVYAMTRVLPAGNGSIFAAVRQLNIFMELSIILGTIAVIETSKGRRAWGYLNAVPATALLFLGFVTFTKQGMYTPCVCWIIGLAYTKMRLKAWTIVGIIGWAVFAIMALAPIAQVGRNLGAGDLTEGWAVASGLLEHIGDTRLIYTNAIDDSREVSGSYYGKDIGMVARFSRIDGDDMLISYTSHGHYVGYDGLRYSFLNWFPHFLIPDKEKYMPAEMGGNSYAREIGMLPASDRTTGISFGGPAEAFHMDGWRSVILVQLMVWILLFASVDLICGDVRRSPWGLLLAVAFSHVAPESGVLGLIGYMWVGNLGIFFAMIFATYGAPVIGALLTTALARQTESLGPDTTRAVSLPANTR